jgi:hypothetical protein
MLRDTGRSIVRGRPGSLEAPAERTAELMHDNRVIATPWASVFTHISTLGQAQSCTSSQASIAVSGPDRQKWTVFRHGTPGESTHFGVKLKFLCAHYKGLVRSRLYVASSFGKCPR